MAVDLRIPDTTIHQRGKGAGGRRLGLSDLGSKIAASVGRSTQFRKFQHTYRDDRVAFVYDCLPDLRRTFAPYQEEILANFDMGIRRQAVRSPHAAGKCVDWDDALLLSDGSWVQAGELIGQTFEVFSVTENLEIERSPAHAFDNGLEDVVEITTKRGKIIRRTLNHPLWADIQPYHWDDLAFAKRIRPQGIWVQAQDLVPGSAVAVIAGYDVEGVEVSDAQLCVTAFLLGDGGLTTNQPYFTQLDKRIVDKMAESCQKMGCELRSVGDSNPLTYRVIAGPESDRQWNGMPVNPVLEKLRSWDMMGRKSAEKEFPAWVWHLPNEQLATFLSYLYACDGWAYSGQEQRREGRWNGKREIGYASTSVSLARDVSRALLRLGVHANLRKKKTSCGEYRGICWCIEIRTVPDILHFAETIGIFGKEDALVDAMRSALNASTKEQQKWRNFGLPDHLRWERVKSVRIIKNRPTVAITVPGNQTFLTEFVEHNTLLAAIIVHHTLLTSEEDVCVPTLASVWRQLEKYLWPEIHKTAKLIDWNRVGREPYTRDELMVHSIRIHSASGPSEAFAIASGDAALIEGAHATRLFYIFDESKSIEDSMWDAAEGAFATEKAVMLTQRGTRAGECYWLAISTPGAPTGRFYDIHSKRAGYEDWKVRHVTIDEAIAAERVGRDWVERCARQWGRNSAVFKNRVLAEFAATESDSVIPMDWIEAAQQRFRDWDAGGRIGEGLDIRKLGVDMARMGDDKTCFAERVGHRIERLHIYTKQTVPVSAGYLKSLARQSQEVMIEMDSGLGASVYDILMAEEDPWNPSLHLIQIYMGAGTSAMDKTSIFRFNCVRSAAWWHLRELLDPESGYDVLLPPDDLIDNLPSDVSLLGDLVAPKYEIKYYHGELAIFVEPKENIKKADRLGRSTDLGDAVVLSFWDDSGGGGGIVF